MSEALKHAFASAMHTSLRIDQRPHSTTVTCKHCGRSSNPRATLDIAVNDLGSHLSTHEEHIDAMVRAFVDFRCKPLRAYMHQREVAGDKEGANEAFKQIREIKREARTMLLREIDEFVASV